ncbi:MAG: amidohydrolase family protein [Promethearchaeota archaeon]
MDKLIVRNGLVFDPLNKIEGEVKDILMQKGVIVDKFSNNSDIKEIDAKGKTVIPSAVDIHVHVASQQVNYARLLGSKNIEFQKAWHGLTLESIAKNYISNGYTFILEANVFPSLARQTIFDFKQLPVLDKAMLLNVSNFWPLELEFQRGKIENISLFLSDLLFKTKGFGLKVYNPFESENYNFNSLRDDLNKHGRLYNFSPMDVYENVTKSVEYLGLPHSVHAHIEGYEQEQGKNNLLAVLRKIKSLNLEPSPKTSLDLKRSQMFHLAHGSAYNIDGNNTELIKFMNENEIFDIDLGFIGFNPINPLITSDRRLIASILQSEKNNNSKKIIRSAVEFEGDFFSTLRSFYKEKYKDCILWANAIELALDINNKWQLQLTVNFPNYASINDLPEIATWLMNNTARNNFMNDMNKDFLNKNSLKNNDKTLTFNEFVIISRASPALSLGLGNIKGNLGPGADADINILNINLEDINIASDYSKLKNALSNIEHVIKAGEIIKKQEMIDLNSQGKIFWSEGKIDTKEKTTLLLKKEEFYQKYSSMFYDSYKISIENKYLRKID